jgi:hypothetical protein
MPKFVKVIRRGVNGTAKSVKSVQHCPHRLNASCQLIWKVCGFPREKPPLKCPMRDGKITIEYEFKGAH